VSFDLDQYGKYEYIPFVSEIWTRLTCHGGLGFILEPIFVIALKYVSIQKLSVVTRK